MFNDRDAIVGLRCLAWYLHLVKDGLKLVEDHVDIVEGRVDAEWVVVVLRNLEPPKKWNIAAVFRDVVIVEK